jgi:hypothetical protein
MTDKFRAPAHPPIDPEITTMTRNATLAAGAVLLIAGVAAIAIIKNNPQPSASDRGADSQAARSKSAGFGTGAAKDAAANTTRARTRDAVKNPELAAKYGESRTNFSKTISSNVVSLLEDAIAMGEMMNSGQMRGMMGGQGAIRMGLGGLYRDLQLSEDQQQRAGEIYASYQQRQMERSKQAVESLKKDPTPLMQLMLASDAKARGEMDDEQYKQLQAESSKNLAGVINPLDERSMRGGSPLADPAFVDEFKGILDADQGGKLQASIEERGSRNDGQIEEGNIANIPAMELEKLDSTISSVKKVTTGIKSMMEGFGGLQEMRPLLEQQGQTPPPEQ